MSHNGTASHTNEKFDQFTRVTLIFVNSLNVHILFSSNCSTQKDYLRDSSTWFLFQAVLRGSGEHIKHMAASIAFFSFLSLFPLLLGMIALAGSVLKSERLQQQVMYWVNEFFPVGAFNESPGSVNGLSVL
jgi:hypothetical protein